MKIACSIILPFVIAGMVLHAEIPAPTGLTQVPPDEGYKLGLNDELEVTIFGAPNSVTRTRIKEDGTITLPFIGSMMAVGRTAREFSVEIGARLRSGGFFVKPVVSVDVTQYVSNSVTVFGHVAQAGIYPLDRAMTVAMMLARSGGTQQGGADYAILRRSDGSEHRILNSSLEGEWSSSTMLKPGDSLYVPVSPQVYVYGQVNAPGVFDLRTGMTVRQALVRAGGPTLAGSERKVTIHRGGADIKHVSPDDIVQPDDQIFVHERLF